MLNSIFSKLSRKSPYDPLITVEISRSRLINNLNEFRKIAPWNNKKDRIGMIAPVLKANAYGHGLVEVAGILEKENWSRNHGPNQGRRIPFFVVDSYYEAMILRKNGIKTHILIIGYTRPENIRNSRGQNTAFTITSMDMLKKIRDIKSAPWDWETGGGNGKISTYIPKIRKARRIHLKIDTGMHRQGILPEEINEAVEIIRNSPSIILEGICSHLSDADNADDSFTESQISIWNKIVKRFRLEFHDLKYVHMSNTDGHKFVSDIDANVSRLGLGLYGLTKNPVLNAKIKILPILEIKTIITGKKVLMTGKHVGYGNTFTAAKNMTVATIPVGYSEGLDRRLSNIGAVTININVGGSAISKPCPIVGRVSMNMSSINITSVPDVKLEDKVVVISNNPAAPNSVVSMAKLCDTIPYDIVVKIPEHLRRVVVE
ncbi:MAG: alanine racemase [Candidatus Taylorbacteria bacterium]